jgi:hypothetical protein
MFSIKQSDTFSWPVKFRLAGDGEAVDHEFTAVFKRLTRSKFDQHVKAVTSNVELIREVMVGWAGVTDERGEPLEFTAANLEALLDIPMVNGAIAHAFLDVQSGAALEKN